MPFEMIDPETHTQFPYHASDIRDSIVKGDRENLKKMVPAEIFTMVEQCVKKEVMAATQGNGQSFIPGRQTVDIVFLLFGPKKKEHYLLVGEREMGKQDFPRMTALPGGGILKFESPIDAAVRVFELETGIDVSVLNNDTEPAKIRINALGNIEWELHFVGIYASLDERVNGTRGGASQCFMIEVEAEKKDVEEMLHSRHDLDNLRLMSLSDAMDIALAFEQSKMLTDAVEYLDFF